jgi:hypothetical protein
LCYLALLDSIVELWMSISTSHNWYIPSSLFMLVNHRSRVSWKYFEINRDEYFAQSYIMLSYETKHSYKSNTAVQQTRVSTRFNVSFIRLFFIDNISLGWYTRRQEPIFTSDVHECTLFVHDDIGSYDNVRHGSNRTQYTFLDICLRTIIDLENKKNIDRM